MNLVLDTNVLLVSISRKSPHRWLWDLFLQGEFKLCITTGILLEYEEIIGYYMGKDAAETVLQIIESAINVKMITRYFHWELIKNDPDDNKFVDCAVAGNANFIVTHDKHFKELEEIAFPKIEIISLEGLRSFLTSSTD